MIKIALVGLACSGKTTIANHINNLESRIIKFAQPHYDILKVLGQEKHRLFMQELSDLCKKHFGDDIFVKIFENSASRYENQNSLLVKSLICDDLRYKIEFDSCVKNNWLMIYVESKDELRKERSDKLGLAWNPNHNSEQTHLFKNNCEYTIENNGTLENLKIVFNELFINMVR